MECRDGRGINLFRRKTPSSGQCRPKPGNQTLFNIYFLTKKLMKHDYFIDSTWKKSLQNTNCFFAQILILGFETRSEVGPLFTARHTSGCAGVGKVCKRHVVGALTTASVGEKRSFPSHCRSWPVRSPLIG